MLVSWAKIGPKTSFLTDDIYWKTGTQQSRFHVHAVNNQPFCNRQVVDLRKLNTSLTYKMPKFSSQRRKKRKFYGNRFT